MEQNPSVSAATEVRAVLEDEAASVGPHSTDFWVLAAALKRFIDGEGQGSLPLEVMTMHKALHAATSAHATELYVSENPLWVYTDTSKFFILLWGVEPTPARCD